MTRLVIRPVTRKVQRAAVAAWHGHHRRSTIGERLALGAFHEAPLVAVIVMGSPAPELDDGACWDVVRLACGPDAPKYTASRLLGAAGRVMTAAGVTLQISYTRVDEPGICYRASGWTPVEVIRGREHTTGNRALRWLPGLYDPGTDIIDRVRWERGERSGQQGALWDGSRWRPSPTSDGGSPTRSSAP